MIRMKSISDQVNVFYYQLFRFERFVQYCVSAPIFYVLRIVGLGDLIARRSRRSNWEEYLHDVLNGPHGGISLFLTDRHFGALLMLCFLIAVNVIGYLLRFDFETYWFYGMIVSLILSLIMGQILVPLSSRQHIKRFRVLDAAPPHIKQKQALVSVLVVISIWLASIFSFVLFISKQQ